MAAKKTTTKNARILVQKAFPKYEVADSTPVDAAPTVRKGASRSVIANKVRGMAFSQTLKKSSAKNLVIRPSASPDADSRVNVKSVIADGKRIIAIQG